MSAQREVKFNVLVTEDRPHAPEHWTVQLQRLLEPQGVSAHVVRSGREAIELAGRTRFHAAVIDLATPMGSSESSATGASGGGAREGLRPKMTGVSKSASSHSDSAGGAGLWLLELFRRLPDRPPVVVLRPPAFTRRQAERLLAETLRLGAFSVINKPVKLDELLIVFRRLVDRQYSGQWPTIDLPSDDQ